MCLASFAENSPTSRNVSTWCSGMINRCTFARGLMSWIATNPFALFTYAPSRAIEQKRQSSRCNGKDPLLRDLRRANADELADPRVDEERRVVVTVPAAGAVDEHRVLRTELRAPARELLLVRERAQSCAALLLHLRRNRVVAGGHRARARRVREDVHLRQAGALDRPDRVLERGGVLGGEADDDVARQVEVAGKRLEPAKVRRGR